MVANLVDFHFMSSSSSEGNITNLSIIIIIIMIILNLQQTLSGEGLRYSQVGMHAKEKAVNPSVTRVTYNTIDVRSSNVIHTLQQERSIERGIRP